MRPTQFLQLREVEHQIVMAGMIHTYAKEAKDETQTPKLIIVGVTVNTAASYIRDVLRANKVPANIVPLGMDMYDASQDGPRGGYQLDRVEFCFFMPDLVAVEKAVFVGILLKILQCTDKERIKFMMQESLIPSFHKTMYHLWERALTRSRVVDAPKDAAEFAKNGRVVSLDTSDVIDLDLEEPEQLTLAAQDVLYLGQHLKCFGAPRLIQITNYDRKAFIVLHKTIARILFLYETYGHDGLHDIDF